MRQRNTTSFEYKKLPALVDQTINHLYDPDYDYPTAIHEARRLCAVLLNTDLEHEYQRLKYKMSHTGVSND